MERRIYKAQGVGDVKVESATLTIDDEMPPFESIEVSKENFTTDAKAAADLLCSTLPGGTLDQLICELLTRRASLFRVPMFDKKEE